MEFPPLWNGLAVDITCLSEKDRSQIELCCINIVHAQEVVAERDAELKFMTRSLGFAKERLRRCEEELQKCLEECLKKAKIEQESAANLAKL